MSSRPVTLASLSGAMDGGFVGVADVADVMQRVGAMSDYRLIGGITVMLHIQRLGLDLPLRATGDADFGVIPHVLREPSLIEEIEKLGYRRTMGNRWERSLDDRRTAAVDLLVPAYTSRPRDTVHVGEVVTTEVPGLATALRRPPVELDTNLQLTDESVRRTKLMLPDALSNLALKAHARTVRAETRDAEDLWRALEVCLHERVQPSRAHANSHTSAPDGSHRCRRLSTTRSGSVNAVSANTSRQIAGSERVAGRQPGVVLCGGGEPGTDTTEGVESRFRRPHPPLRLPAYPELSRSSGVVEKGLR